MSDSTECWAAPSLQTLPADERSALAGHNELGAQLQVNVAING